MELLALPGARERLTFHAELASEPFRVSFSTSASRRRCSFSSSSSIFSDALLPRLSSRFSRSFSSLSSRSIIALSRARLGLDLRS